MRVFGDSRSLHRPIFGSWETQEIWRNLRDRPLVRGTDASGRQRYKVGYCYRFDAYSGFLSSRHHLRSRIAFDQTGHVSTPLQLALFECKHGTERAARTPKRPPTPDRIAWSKLLARVFQIDIERCPKCDGKMKIKQAVVDPDLISEGLRNRDLSPPDSVQLPAQDGPPYLPPTAAAHRNLATPPRTGARGPPTLVPLPGQTLLFDACV